jgi:hypothetical protein
MSLSLAPMLTSRPAQVNVALRYVAAVACAASAGVHVALIPDHLGEGGVRLGGAFAVAAVLLAAAAIVLRRPRHGSWAPLAGTAVLAGTAMAYLLSRTTGIPVLIPSAEGADLVGEITSAAELVGAVAAALLSTRKDLR